MNSVTFDGKDIYPSKIVCVGRNYLDHIKELDNEIPNEPVIFLKPNSSISSEIHSRPDDVIHFEGEIAFLVIDDELQGVGFGLDLTKREVQSELRAQSLPWERAKSFDKSAVFSQFVSFSGNIDDLRMELFINDKIAQQGGCDVMLNKPDDILHEAKSFLSFENGDILMTGTPRGVGIVNPGDKFSGKIFEIEELIVEGSWIVK